MIYANSCHAIGWRKQPNTIDTETSNDVGGSGIENSNNKNSYNNHIHNHSLMDKTYLDLFGESAKEFLTQKAPEKLKTVFPDTDDECRWDWRYLRCEPYCECSFRPKLPGDFHLGRACRRRSGSHPPTDEASDPTTDDGDDETSEKYQAYCGHGRNESPPSPSIPSPFPFLARSGRATWKIFRTRADPVVAKAVTEVEMMHGRFQTVVCRDLKTRCSVGEGAAFEYEPEEIAWQERLFCRDIVEDCKAAGTALQNETSNDPKLEP
jgi:hypothetical protein